MKQKKHFIVDILLHNIIIFLKIITHLRSRSCVEQSELQRLRQSQSQQCLQADALMSHTRVETPESACTEHLFGRR